MDVVDAVERATASLVAAVPRSGRLPGVPLAEALAGFEAGLADARHALDVLRGRPTDGADAVALDRLGTCARALDEAGARAEAFRLGEPPRTYEELIAAIADLTDPLEAFERLAAGGR